MEKVANDWISKLVHGQVYEVQVEYNGLRTFFIKVLSHHRCLIQESNKGFSKELYMRRFNPECIFPNMHQIRGIAGGAILGTVKSVKLLTKIPFNCRLIPTIPAE